MFSFSPGLRGEFRNGNRAMAAIRIVCFQLALQQRQEWKFPLVSEPNCNRMKAQKCATQNEELHEGNIIT